MEYDDHDTIGTPSGADDRRAFVSAASSLARLDETLVRLADVRKLYYPPAIRREAAAIASLEGGVSRPEAIALLLADPDATLMERGARTAADIGRALGMIQEWSPEGPDAAAVSHAFMTSDASTSRLIRPDMAWSLEEDCEFTSEEMARVHETPEPWTAIEAIRRIWTSGRFFGHSRRMALVLAPWLIMTGFGGSTPVVGLADRIRREPDRFRKAESNQDIWAVLVAETLGQASLEQITRIGDLQGLRATLCALCPAERSSSSVRRAVDHFIAMPIRSAKAFGEALGLTPRGAKVVLDKLVAAGIIEVDGGARNRNFVCRRAL